MLINKNKPTPITLLCPITRDCHQSQSSISLTRACLQGLGVHDESPMAKVPNTFLCRFFILSDVYFEGYDATEDHLQNAYLVFCCNCHGSVDEYFRGFWQYAQETIHAIWRFCVAFDQVHDADSFVAYIKKCLVKTTFYFNGSCGEPLAEQLKALYLKQELSQFVCDHQNAPAADLQRAFQAFVQRTQPENLTAPTWHPGKNSL